MSQQNVLLPDAVGWLITWPAARVLTIDGGPQPARLLRDEGHEVFALGPNHQVARQLAEEEGITPICGQAEAIPTDPCQFDAVFCHGRFHRLDAVPALSEIARVLRPGGCFSASYVIRDDSVPWVRRLAALLRRYDPMAMRGEYGHASLDVLRESKYFPDVERRAFRIWQPISLKDLRDLVAGQPLCARLDPDQRSRLMSEVDGLFNTAARQGELLRLPFQLLCVRAWVSHEELTAPTVIPDDGVHIPLHPPTP